MWLAWLAGDLPCARLLSIEYHVSFRIYVFVLQCVVFV